MKEKKAGLTTSHVLPHCNGLLEVQDSQNYFEDHFTVLKPDSLVSLCSQQPLSGNGDPPLITKPTFQGLAPAMTPTGAWQPKILNGVLQSPRTLAPDETVSHSRKHNGRRRRSGCFPRSCPLLTSCLTFQDTMELHLL